MPIYLFVSVCLMLILIVPIFYFRASFMTKTVQYQNELHKFLIWDTAGQERVNSNNHYTHWGDTYTS